MTEIETDVNDSCVNATVAYPEGNPAVGAGRCWAALATNCLSQRLGMETATATAAAFPPKFEPSTVIVCDEATRCAGDTKETVGAARDRTVAGASVKSGKVKVFLTPSTDNSNAIPATSCAFTLNGVWTHENALDVKALGFTEQGDTTDIKKFETSAAAPKLVMGSPLIV